MTQCIQTSKVLRQIARPLVAHEPDTQPINESIQRARFGYLDVLQKFLHALLAHAIELDQFFSAFLELIDAWQIGKESQFQKPQDDLVSQTLDVHRAARRKVNDLARH